VTLVECERHVCCECSHVVLSCSLEDQEKHFNFLSHSLLDALTNVWEERACVNTCVKIRKKSLWVVVKT